MKSQIIAVLLSVILQKTSSSSVFPKGEFSVQIGEGFSTYLVRDPKFGELFGCQLKDIDRNKVYKIYPATSSGPWVTDNNEVITPYVDDCGAHVASVSAKSSRNWQLVALDDNLERIDGQFSIHPIENMGKKTVIRVKGTPGQRTLVLCPQRTKTSECVIIDREGQKFNGCILEVVYPEVNREDIYMCQDGAQAMEAMIIVKGTHATSVKEIIRNENSVVLSCKSVEKLQWCVGMSVETPRTVGIERNTTYQRYSFANTNLDRGICQLQIPTPLLANETGVWRIWGLTNRNISNEFIPTGCIFHLDNYPDAAMENLRLRARVSQTINTEKPYFSVKCEEAPYKLKYCYLLSPDYKIHYAKPAVFSLTSELGVCSFQGMRTKAGRWFCGFNALNENEPDIVQKIKVLNDPVLEVAASPDNVKVPKHEPISLLCRTLKDQPIQSCMFISPTRVIYNLPSSSFSSSSYSYYGRGFHNGDCGMTLPPPDPQNDLPELGNYTCSVIVKGNHFSYRATVKLW